MCREVGAVCLPQICSVDFTQQCAWAALAPFVLLFDGDVAENRAPATRTRIKSACHQADFAADKRGLNAGGNNIAKSAIRSRGVDKVCGDAVSSVGSLE